MQSVTKEYLLDIISRKISTTIKTHRLQHPYPLNNFFGTAPAASEMEDFIASIPYFDTTLKQFLTATAERQTIISHQWEIEFIKKCDLWIQSYEWLYGKPSFLNENNSFNHRLTLLY
ncbi:MAG: hypothetical protein QM791_18690 [Ferruginibacter sp.]